MLIDKLICHEARRSASIQLIAVSRDFKVDHAYDGYGLTKTALHGRFLKFPLFCPPVELRDNIWVDLSNQVKVMSGIFHLPLILTLRGLGALLSLQG